MRDETQEEKNAEKAHDEKGLPYHVMEGATSFADVDAAEAAYKETERLYELLSAFQSLTRNVMQNSAIGDKPGAIAGLVAELGQRIANGSPDDATKEAKAPSSNLLDGTDGGLMLWKDATTGTLRWLGTHTNNFIDRDNPPDILSAQAHQRFVERVEKSQAPTPDLWIWHVPVPVGEVDYLGWDDAGFLVSSGTVVKEWETTVQDLVENARAQKIPLGMSHGMPLETIRRDPTDPRVITEYESREVSILPLDKAASVLTTFELEENVEKGLRKAQREQLVSLVGEEHVQKIEGRLSRQAQKAQSLGLARKEADPETDETESVVDKVLMRLADVLAPHTKEAAAPDKEDKPEKKEEAEAEAAAAPVSTPISKEVATKEELAGVIASALTDVVKEVTALKKSVTELETRLSERQAGEDERIAQKAAQTPPASLSALVAKMLAPANSNGLGTPLAADDPLMKAAPQGKGGADDVRGFGGHL